MIATEKDYHKSTHIRNESGKSDHCFPSRLVWRDSFEEYYSIVVCWWASLNDMYIVCNRPIYTTRCDVNEDGTVEVGCEILDMWYQDKADEAAKPSKMNGPSFEQRSLEFYLYPTRLPSNIISTIILKLILLTTDRHKGFKNGWSWAPWILILLRRYPRWMVKPRYANIIAKSKPFW